MISPSNFEFWAVWRGHDAVIWRDVDEWNVTPLLTSLQACTLCTLIVSTYIYCVQASVKCIISEWA